MRKIASASEFNIETPSRLGISCGHTPLCLTAITSIRTLCRQIECRKERSRRRKERKVLSSRLHRPATSRQVSICTAFCIWLCLHTLSLSICSHTSTFTPHPHHLCSPRALSLTCMYAPCVHTANPTTVGRWGSTGQHRHSCQSVMVKIGVKLSLGLV